MSKSKWLGVGVIFLNIAYAVNAVVSNFGDPMPMDDGECVVWLYVSALARNGLGQCLLAIADCDQV